ncbi:hypothetical protein ALI144C_07295 [Actinosynnema sp. ALI-1.44]|uniref:glycosyltransferase n=1 Tax=Actinosynnema sp. ALI-1.44 TaxID=1933779 RepID=UPI00097C5CEA|nr:glycosyltransferase [Actinosynnema sp. ALI-1.44]ONI88245.1 hypothetical protein ALI144C_07295 [Actinosynnema sp. ALI-1.44]
MRVCAVVKYPPIQGGVSANAYWMARSLAESGHRVDVVTNAGEVEDAYRIFLGEQDLARLEASFPNGGQVRVITSGRFEGSRAAVPASDSYVTKLAGLAMETVRAHDADVLFSNYFEPYGISAHLASTWTGVPHVTKHAGSDRVRLMDHPELGLVYREVVRAARLVIGDPDLAGLGVDTERIAEFPPVYLPAEFTPNGPVADLDAMTAAWSGSPFVRAPASFDPGNATIGIYGKLGAAKGTYDLVAALARLRRRGVRFNFLAVAGGGERGSFLRAVDQAGLTDVTWTLPFVPHWRVPEILRACTAVCVLERDFPVEIHRPSLPYEVLACGTCAVVSAAVARTQPALPWASVARVVDDPRDIDALAAVLDDVISDPARAAALGSRGADVLPRPDPAEFSATYEALFDTARTAPTRTESGLSVDRLRDLVRRHMPVTVQQLPAQVELAITESARGQRLAGKAAIAVASAVLDRVDAWETVTLREVVRFEQHRLWLAVDAEPEGRPVFPHQHHAVDGEAATASSRPVRSNWLRFEEFAVDVVRAQHAITNTLPLPPQPDQPVLLMFHKRRSLKGRAYRINRHTHELIDLCDGIRTVAEICDVVGRRNNLPVAKVRDQLHTLAATGVISPLTTNGRRRGEPE